MYLNCEQVILAAFDGRPPAHLRFTSKCRLGTPPRGEITERLRRSVEASLLAMGLAHIDLFFLHTNIRADDYVFAVRPDRQDVFSTTWSCYAQEFIPAMQAMQRSGKIGHWGITGIGVPAMIDRALNAESRPAAVQAVANLLDSAGGMKNFAESQAPRAIIATAASNGVGVMGIRAVQAGALTASIDRDLPPDHPEMRDYVRAEPFRALCRDLGEDPADIAHRYALSMAGVDTVVLGVKNRAELRRCLDAEAAGVLDPALVSRIDSLIQGGPNEATPTRL